MELAVVALICRGIGFNPEFKEALIIIACPLCLALIPHLLSVNWLIDTLLMFSLPYIAYLKVGILNREDLRDLSYALATKQVVDEIYQHLHPIIDRLID